jgi:outer membrane protein TolC
MKRFPAIVPLVLAALLAPPFASPSRGGEAPSDPERLTLEDCLRIGLERGASIRRARLGEIAADARIGETRADVLPQLRVSGEYRRLDAVPSFDVEGNSVPVGRTDNYAAGAEASQLLYSGGSVSAALKAARQYRERARVLTRQETIELERDIRVGFHDVLLAVERFAVQGETVAQLESFVAESERRCAAGTESEFDLLSARVRLANEEPTLIAARRDLTLARESFRHLLRLDRETFELEGVPVYEPLDVPVERCLALARNGRPDLQAQALIVDLLAADIRYEQGFGLPQIRARAAYQGANPDTTFGSAADEWGWHWNAGFAADWSVFDGARRRSVIRQKTIEREQAILDLDELGRSVELEVRRAWLELQHAGEVVEAARETESLAERSLDIARVRHETGLSTYLEFTDAALALRTARLAWRRALRDHLAARAELCRACGLSGDEWPEEKTP